MRSLARSCLPALLWVAAVLTPTVALAEFPKAWWEFDYPADSAFWWPSSDLVSAQQLRTEISDPEEHKKRFEHSVQGLATEEEKAEVRGHLDGSATPELIPMWLSFRVLISEVAHRPPTTLLQAQAIPYAPEPAHSTASWDGLVEIGEVAKPSATLIVERAREMAVEISAEAGRRAPDIRAYQTLFDELAAAVGEESALSLFEEEDAQEISLKTTLPSSEVARLLTASRTDPNIEVVLTGLEALKAELSPADWQGLRTYLDRGVAPTISVYQQTSTPSEAP